MSVTAVMQEYCDAIITTSPEVYEPEGTAQMRKWMNDTGREFWCLGPSLPLQKNHHGLSTENQLSKNAHEIQQFMDRILKERGEKSLLYVGLLCSMVQNLVLPYLDNRSPSVLCSGHLLQRNCGRS